MWRLPVSFLSLQAGAASLTLMDQKLHSLSEGKTDSGLSSGDVAEIVVFFLLEAAAAVAGIIIVVFLLLLVAAAVVYCRHRSHTAVPPNEDDDNSPSDPTFV